MAGVTSHYDASLGGHTGYLAFCNAAQTLQLDNPGDLPRPNPVSGTATVSQTLSTTPGQDYVLYFTFTPDASFWRPGPGGLSNPLYSRFNGKVVMDASNMVPRLPDGWNGDGTALWSYFVRATGSQTLLQFSAEITGDQGMCLGLDDVQVLPVGLPFIGHR
jgi:hypothetical protein